jgi:hypothetical protein
MHACAAVRHALRLPAARRLAAALATAAASTAFAAVDDQNSLAADSFPAPIALGRRAAAQDASIGRATPAAIESRPAAAPTPPPSALRNPPRAAPLVATRMSAAAASATAAEAGRPASAPADAAFGARWRVLQGDGDLPLPRVAWMADVEPANAAVLARPTASRPSLHLSGEWSLTDDLSLGVMPGMAFDTDALGRRQANGTLAVTLGKSWTSQWRTYVDLARDHLGSMMTAAPGIGAFGGASTTLDAGLTFLAVHGTQLDLALTHGLSAAAPDFQAGIGLSSSF